VLLDDGRTGTALIDDASGRSWTHAELTAAAQAMADRLRAPAKDVVLVRSRMDAATVIAYLGALQAGHAVLPADGETAEIERRYAPRFVVAGGDVEDRGPAAPGAAVPHPDLALLLSTSGTTGSPRLVRLSAAAVQANAAAIAAYLELDPNERALASLPFGYSYGLSVLNSHLLAGAAVVLPAEGVVRPAFWEAFERHGCTSLAGVPYSYKLMERVGWRRRALPSLRTMTQAGGRMEPDAVRSVAAELARRGARLVVMYGQTEATARIAYVPPEILARKPGSIGVAIPGGELWVDEGELVYRGPNVMLGYATTRDDLARGDDLGGVLRTGDLGHVDDDGCFFVTGRLKRIAKVHGLRVNLDEVEALVAGGGPAAALGAGDDRLAVFVEGDPEVARAALADGLALRGRSVVVRPVERLPVTSSGKIDYHALARELGRAA
jgi:acyl-CoA synthetase (AMP-forming)/AMP-acid ligase II